MSMGYPARTDEKEYSPFLGPDEIPGVENLVTEDEAPVDNIFSEKQQRLLTETLYSSWPGPGEGRTFVALANVGFFFNVHQPPFVPDMMLSLDVAIPEEVQSQRNRSYFLWEYGKPPEVIVEIVSKTVGEERGKKLDQYAWLGVAYYVILDPLGRIQEEPLVIHTLKNGRYVEQVGGWLHGVNLGLKLWKGPYEGLHTEWLRWYDGEGQLILTGAERAQAEAQRAQAEAQRAQEADRRAQSESERAQAEAQRAQAAEQRAERLARLLREMGVEPPEDG